MTATPTLGQRRWHRGPRRWSRPCHQARSERSLGEAPGGILELDESFEAGVRREVLEETGSGGDR